MNLFSFHHRRETKYIHLWHRKCQGCWKCVEICPKDVLAGRGRLNHGHVRIKDRDACNGCKKCVRVCVNNAIEYIYVPRSRQHAAEKEKEN